MKQIKRNFFGRWESDFNCAATCSVYSRMFTQDDLLANRNKEWWKFKTNLIWNMANEFSIILYFSSIFFIFLISIFYSEVFSPVSFLEMKINKCFKYVQILCVLFFWCHHSLATEKRVNFSLLTLHHIRQGALPLADCLRAARYFLCSELRLDAVLPPIKLKHGMRVFNVSSLQPCSTANSKVSFYVSLRKRFTLKFGQEILCVLFTLTSSFASNWKKSSG